MSDLLRGKKGTAVIMDDTNVHGKSDAEHVHLAEVLATVEESGLKLNKGKCEFQKKKIEFFGHRINKDDSSDPEKVKATTMLSSPLNKREFRRFLGMVNYSAKFTPNLSSVLQPLK